MTSKEHAVSSCGIGVIIKPFRLSVMCLIDTKEPKNSCIYFKELQGTRPKSLDVDTEGKQILDEPEGCFK